MKEAFRALASRALVASGATRLGRRLGDRNGTFIFYGHRVRDDEEGFFRGLPPHWLHDQLAYLTRHYEMISLSTLVACIEEQRPPPPRSVVLTFDDGFRDNVELALPILEAFDVPATIFVVTGSLSDGRLPWSQRLGYAFQHTDEAVVQHELLGSEPIALGSEAQRRRAYALAKKRLVSSPRAEREAVIDGLEERLGVAAPGDRMMTWDQAREVVRAGHEVGAHTVSHPLLARIAPAEARWEMERSLFDVRERLGIERPSFCFPAGSTSRALQALARDLGFRSCFVPDPSRRLNRPGLVDAFSLVRMGLPNAPAVQLEAELDGPFHAVRHVVGRYGPMEGR